MEENNYLRERKHYKFTTPKTDALISGSMYPNMQTYNNWPSREAMEKNQAMYLYQKEQAKRLSPNNILYKTQSRFLSPRRSSYYNDKGDITELVKDPIAMAVEENRLKLRSQSTLKSTKQQSHKQLNKSYRNPQMFGSPFSRIKGPQLQNKFFSGT